METKGCVSIQCETRVEPYAAATTRIRATPLQPLLSALITSFRFVIDLKRIVVGRRSAFKEVKRSVTLPKRAQGGRRGLGRGRETQRVRAGACFSERSAGVQKACICLHDKVFGLLSRSGATP